VNDIDRLHTAISDRYRVETEIGRGGMATVYLAQDLKHERKVAIKVVDPELASVVGGERFLREIQIEAHLDHPNILPLHDSGEANGFLYYVMPYVEGESLRERLDREKELPVTEALRITREVADALSYAHEQDVIHRDIKPENILFRGGHAVLADFGIARAIGAAGGERVTESGYVIGTPAYMSPEQASGEHEVDGRSDTYSLACVLYEMLCGEPPFSGRSSQALLLKHMAEPAPSVETLCPSVPRHVARTVERGLSKTPGERYTTGDFAAALEKPERTDGWVGVLRELGARRIWHIGALYLVLGGLAIELARLPIAERALPGWVFAGLFTLVAIGFPITLALAWLQGRPRSQIRSRWVRHVRAGYSLAFLGTIVIGLLAVRASMARIEPVSPPIEVASSIERTHIAVLPFTDLSEGGTLDHISAGFTRELIKQLTQVEPLTVKSYNGVRQYRDTDLPPDSIARALGVGTIVEASLQESEGELRVTVDMLDALSGTNLATSTVAEPRTELFALQDDIVQEVSQFLREQLGVETRHEEWLAETESREAWELVLQAEELRDSVGDLGAVEDLSAAAVKLQQADALLAEAETHDLSWLDPILQRGWIMHDLARVEETAPNASDQELVEMGLSHADRAAEMEAGDAEVLELRGALLLAAWESAGTDQDAATLGAAEETLLQAVELDPTRARAWAALSNVYHVRGLYGSALRAARNAFEADAFLRDATVVFYGICKAYWDVEDHERAMPCFAEGRQRWPNNAGFVEPELTHLASAGGPEPDVEKAWGLFDLTRDLMGAEKFAAYEPSFLMIVAGVLARAGLADSAHSVMETAQADLDPDDPWPLYFQANVLVNLGDLDTALDRLGQFLEAQPDYKGFIATDYWWRLLRDDPRFRAMTAE